MNNKQSFLNKYFVITIILLAVGGVYYFKFYNTENTADNSSTLIEENKKEAESETSATTPKAVSKPVTKPKPKVEVPSTKTILLKNNFVSVKNNTFSPSVIVIRRGTEITWTNEDNTGHRISYDINDRENPLPELGSKILSKGQSYVFMFTKPGTYNYYCGLHPFMKGTVIVTD